MVEETLALTIRKIVFKTTVKFTKTYCSANFEDLSFVDKLFARKEQQMTSCLLKIQNKTKIYLLTLQKRKKMEYLKLKYRER